MDASNKASASKKLDKSSLHRQTTPVIRNRAKREFDFDTVDQISPPLVPKKTASGLLVVGGDDRSNRHHDDDDSGDSRKTVDEIEEESAQARRKALLTYYGAPQEALLDNKGYDDESEDSSSSDDDIVALLLRQSSDAPVPVPPPATKAIEHRQDGEPLQSRQPNSRREDGLDLLSNTQPIPQMLAKPKTQQPQQASHLPNDKDESFHSVKTGTISPPQRLSPLRKSHSTESFGSCDDLPFVQQTQVVSGRYAGEETTPTATVPTHVEYRSEFDVGELKPWWVDNNDNSSSDENKNNNHNCFGVVHVRVIRAQHLPCPVSSHVQAVIHLHPWKGKVRVAEKATAFAGINSVCVQWENDDATAMVHAYSDEEGSPVPEIQIDLVFTPLGMFEFTMCSVRLSCQPLLQFPNEPKRQWVSTSAQADYPIIEVEAMFEPVTSDNKADDETEGRDPAQTADDGAESTTLVGDGALDLSDKESTDGSILGDTSFTQLSAKGSNNDGSLVDSSSLHSMRKTDRMIKADRHLLQLTTFRIPAYCCVCGNSLMSGLWKKIALRCEVCKVDSCDDCRLQVAIQLPCNSVVAQKAVEDAIQNKFTMDRMMNAIAPFDDRSDREKRPVSELMSKPEETPFASTERGVGTMKLKFVKAHILMEHLPADEDPQSIASNKELRVRPGDYYVRVAWTGSKKTARTRIVEQSKGRPNLESSGEMCFVVPHYGTEFRIELIDATTDKPIGTSLITTQGLLQQQRDFLIEEKRVPFLSFLRPIKFTEMRRIAIELRAGLKSGFSSDFFAALKGHSSDGEVKPGDIVGCIEVDACFEEDLESLYGKRPYECPPRPGEELNMSVFQVHLSRISTIIEDVKRCVETYRYIVSWKNPLVTGFSLYVFLLLCMRFDTAYFGSGPVFLLILCMLYFAGKRSYVKAKQTYIQKEIEKNRKAENGTFDYDVHRPVGLVRVSVVGGRNIRSPELGLPGNVGCRVFWDPSRYLSGTLKEKANEIDESTGSLHEVGATNSVYAVNPVWDRMLESDGSKRLKSLMPSQGAFFDKVVLPDVRKEIDFPVLQPIGMRDDLQCLEPWATMPAALVVEVNFSDLLNALPGSENSVGEVLIPFSELVQSGELSGWYDVIAATEPEVSPTLAATAAAEGRASDAVNGKEGSNAGRPQLQICASWIPPEENSDLSIETEREASYAIQEEMVRSALLSRQRKEKLTLLGSSIGALNTVRGISANLQVVQNTLGSVLDLLESCIHAFDFTDPYKSMMVLSALLVVWVVLSMVSTRMIILTAGLAQYSLTFKARFERWLRSGKSSAPRNTFSSTKEEASEGPVAIWLMNALRGLPTSEDLRKSYFWESRRLGARETETLAAEKRRSRLQRLWKVQWYSKVRMLTHDETNDSAWHAVFAMIQGHRLLWWRSVVQFDSGLPPLGRLFLAGHAGLSSPSPLELRYIDPDHVHRVVCLFGSGSRATILTQTGEAKEELEKAVVDAVSSKQD